MQYKHTNDMNATSILTIALKELRELVSRPWQLITLVMGPLAIMACFGIGANATAQPPVAIVVMPPGQERPRLLQDYQRQFDQFLHIAAYTHDEEYARSQLRREAVDAVILLPVTPFQTIAEGRQATIRVLYNQIDPIWRWVVPNFTQVMAGEINREIFLQTVGTQQSQLRTAARAMEYILQSLQLAVSAANDVDAQDTQHWLDEARTQTGELAETLDTLGPAAAPLRGGVARLRAQLQQANQRLAEADPLADEPDAAPLREQLGLDASIRNVQQLQETLNRLTTVSPEVVISPLTLETQNLARLEPDIVTFYAPSIVALLIQHTAVSMGALALVRERLSGTFDLYIVAPISPLHLLLGKYVAYLIVTLTIATAVVAVLLGGMGVPLLGSPWRFVATLIVLAVTSVGLGFTLSLLASSERQAVQFAMLLLLGVVFFSGFTLPLSALRQPALGVAYTLPATYGIRLLQDVMLRGGADGPPLLSILSGIAVLLFVVCAALLYRRTRAQ